LRFVSRPDPYGARVRAALGVVTAPWPCGGLPVQMTDALPLYGFTSVAKRKVLRDTVGVGRAEELRLSEGPATTGILGLEQVAAAGAAEQHLSAAGYLEAFGHRFSGFNAFGASHIIYFLEL